MNPSLHVAMTHRTNRYWNCLDSCTLRDCILLLHEVWMTVPYNKTAQYLAASDMYSQACDMHVHGRCYCAPAVISETWYMFLHLIGPVHQLLLSLWCVHASLYGGHNELAHGALHTVCLQHQCPWGLSAQL